MQMGRVRIEFAVGECEPEVAVIFFFSFSFRRITTLSIIFIYFSNFFLLKVLTKHL